MVTQVAESTTKLLQASRNGDQGARNRLFAHCRPILLRWTHARLPGFARDLADTEDVVQVALTRALNRLDHFENRGPGSFLGYLRTIALNSVKEELRRSGRRGEETERFDIAGDDSNPVLNTAIGVEALARYECALKCLSPAQHDMVVLRMEFGFSYAEIAAETGAASANAARRQVSRALIRLAELMKT